MSRKAASTRGMTPAHDAPSPAPVRGRWRIGGREETTLLGVAPSRVNDRGTF